MCLYFITRKDDIFVYVYKNPLYYEIAFSFVNAKKQIDLFETFVKKFSIIQVKTFLDIGCGPSLQLREIAKRGYSAVGLDTSSRMLQYLKQKAKEERIAITTVRGDMHNFKLTKKADCAFILMGTVSYMKSNSNFLSHLDVVANALNKGGLYIIENLRLDWTSRHLFKKQEWIMKRGDTQIKTTYMIRQKDVLKQMLEETMVLNVNDNGKRKTLKEKVDTKIIFPQEFVELVKMNGKFEFLGWFERNTIKPLKKASMNNITLLRRK